MRPCSYMRSSLCPAGDDLTETPTPEQRHTTSPYEHTHSTILIKHTIPQSCQHLIHSRTYCVLPHFLTSYPGVKSRLSARKKSLTTYASIELVATSGRSLDYVLSIAPPPASTNPYTYIVHPELFCSLLYAICSGALSSFSLGLSLSTKKSSHPGRRVTSLLHYRGLYPPNLPQCRRNYKDTEELSFFRQSGL
ncbi:hypothetical protein KQX54_012814 [Cotesia glomerata]|uniref:Uncharacterized protein n=1 Tax=Cotesia glomerata TaxID=32391 RepID=A0AAV7J0S7_COTGL|nr:hypothetical protein KQX54_012814 [Cotesia glomerata]